MVSGEDVLVHLSANFFIHFNKNLLGIYYVSGTVLGSDATQEDKTYRAITANQDPFQTMQRPNHKAQKP